jgi:hypothetical protein
METSEETAMQDENEHKGPTRSQIIYWSISLALLVGGCIGTLVGYLIPYVGWIIQALGPGIFTAGILAVLAEPHFRKEFARDAFLAAFRYVLPKEFKEEVEKIIRFEFIASTQLWTVKIEKVDGGTVRVTTSFEKNIKNRSKSAREKDGYYTVPDFSFSNGPSQILDCAIEYEDEKETHSTLQTQQGPN